MMYSGERFGDQLLFAPRRSIRRVAKQGLRSFRVGPGNNEKHVAPRGTLPRRSGGKTRVLLNCDILVVFQLYGRFPETLRFGDRVARECHREIRIGAPARPSFAEIHARRPHAATIRAMGAHFWPVFRKDRRSEAPDRQLSSVPGYCRLKPAPHIGRIRCLERSRRHSAQIQTSWATFASTFATVVRAWPIWSKSANIGQLLPLDAVEWAELAEVGPMRAIFAPTSA